MTTNNVSLNERVEDTALVGLPILEPLCDYTDAAMNHHATTTENKRSTRRQRSHPRRIDSPAGERQRSRLTKPSRRTKGEKGKKLSLPVKKPRQSSRFDSDGDDDNDDCSLPTTIICTVPPCREEVTAGRLPRSPKSIDNATTDSEHRPEPKQNSSAGSPKPNGPGKSKGSEGSRARHKSSGTESTGSEPSQPLGASCRTSSGRQSLSNHSNQNPKDGRSSEKAPTVRRKSDLEIRSLEKRPGDPASKPNTIQRQSTASGESNRSSSKKEEDSAASKNEKRSPKSHKVRKRRSSDAKESPSPDKNRTNKDKKPRNVSSDSKPISVKNRTISDSTERKTNKTRRPSRTRSEDHIPRNERNGPRATADRGDSDILVDPRLKDEDNYGTGDRATNFVQRASNRSEKKKRRTHSSRRLKCKPPPNYEKESKSLESSLVEILQRSNQLSSLDMSKISSAQLGLSALHLSKLGSSTLSEASTLQGSSLLQRSSETILNKQMASQAWNHYTDYEYNTFHKSDHASIEDNDTYPVEAQRRRSTFDDDCSSSLSDKEEEPIHSIEISIPVQMTPKREPMLKEDAYESDGESSIDPLDNFSPRRKPRAKASFTYRKQPATLKEDSCYSGDDVEAEILEVVDLTLDDTDKRHPSFRSGIDTTTDLTNLSRYQNSEFGGESIIPYQNSDQRHPSFRSSALTKNSGFTQSLSTLPTLQTQVSGLTMPSFRVTDMDNITETDLSPARIIGRSITTGMISLSMEEDTNRPLHEVQGEREEGKGSLPVDPFVVVGKSPIPVRTPISKEKKGHFRGLSGGKIIMSPNPSPCSSRSSKPSNATPDDVVPDANPTISTTWKPLRRVSGYMDPQLLQSIDVQLSPAPATEFLRREVSSGSSIDPYGMRKVPNDKGFLRHSLDDSTIDLMSTAKESVAHSCESSVSSLESALDLLRAQGTLKPSKNFAQLQLDGIHSVKILDNNGLQHIEDDGGLHQRRVVMDSPVKKPKSASRISRSLREKALSLRSQGDGSKEATGLSFGALKSLPITGKGVGDERATSRDTFPISKAVFEKSGETADMDSFSSCMDEKDVEPASSAYKETSGGLGHKLRSGLPKPQLGLAAFGATSIRQLAANKNHTTDSKRANSFREKQRGLASLRSSSVRNLNMVKNTLLGRNKTSETRTLLEGDSCEDLNY